MSTGETLFATGETGTKVANFIKLNNAYEFCLWTLNHTVKQKCVEVTTAYKQVKLDLGFIKDLKVEPRGHSCRIKFTTVRSSLPVVQLSQTAPNKIIGINNKDVASFADGVEFVSHFAGGGTVHETIFSNLYSNTNYFL